MTRLGRQFTDGSRQNAGRSAFRILNVGIDGFLMRLEMIDAAERTLDLQYYIFRGDESGGLLINALARAAERGVRVRVLVDDGETKAGDEKVLALDGHAGIEIRIFNPWAYRGHGRFRRGAEYLLRHSRLDYRMHNKMFVVDGAVALVGGRNVGDEYFQIDPESQLADDDLFVGGLITQKLSAKFDEFWNSPLAIPAGAFARRERPDATSMPHPRSPAQAQKAAAAGLNYREKLASGEPLAGILAGTTPLVWSDAQFVCDSPDKKAVVAGRHLGDLMFEPVAKLTRQAKTELLVVTPYFVPSKDELQLMEARRRQGVTVRVLTNSLESNPDLVAHAGYTHYRVALLREGVQFSEVRALLGDSRGSGQSARLSRYGNYALHAKLYILDRRDLFIGSMNFDSRSRRLNTEMGLIIDNPELAQQQASRFEAMTRAENAYSLALESDDARKSPRLVWRTREDGKAVEYKAEPARSTWQKVKARILSWLPLDSEL